MEDDIIIHNDTANQILDVNMYTNINKKQKVI